MLKVERSHVVESRARGGRPRRQVAVLLLLATLASVLAVCAPDLVGEPVQPAAAAVPPDPEHPRACPEQTISSGDQFVSSPRHVRIYVPDGKQLTYRMEVIWQGSDPDGVWRQHFRVQQTNSGPSPAFLLDRVHDGTQTIPLNKDEFSGGTEAFTTGGWIDLSISEVDGRPIKFWLRLGTNAVTVSPDCRDRDASEGYDPSCMRCSNDVLIVDPVNTRTGNMHMPLPGLTMPGRGPGLAFGLAYNSLAATTATCEGSRRARSDSSRLGMQGLL